jgi:hypothetical protein
MKNILKPIFPVLVVEFILTAIQASLASSGHNIQLVTILFYEISLIVMPFFAGYLAARSLRKDSLWVFARAGASVSLASIAAISIVFWVHGSGDKYLLSVIGYLISTILLALGPQVIFGMAGGWVFKRAGHKYGK